MTKHPAMPWVLPFAVFMALLAISPQLGLPPRADLVLRLALPTLAVVLFSRKVLDFRCASPLISVLVGIGVFVLWVAPDLIWPGYRESVLFQNPLTGSLKSSLSADARSDWLSISLRVARASLIVPVVEELFWRGWLMRWLADPDFEKLPVGHYDKRAFWITAALFALEHGPYWDVGLAAGAVYNGYLVRTRRLGDLILAHAVTNACLAAFVLWSGRWEFWL
jgi:hypothetical protein